MTELRDPSPEFSPERGPPPAPATGDEGAELDSLVLRLRRRALLVHGGTAAALFVAAGLLVALAAGGALALGAGEWVRDAWRLVLALAAAGALTLALYHLRRATPVRLARDLEGREPAAAGLESAVELLALLRTKDEQPFSLELARAHVARVTERARTIDPSSAFDLRPLVRAGASAAGAALLVGGLALLVSPLAGGLGRLLATTPNAPEAARAVEPITGEIELVYIYPAHTGLPTKTLPGTNGEISAPRGTAVKLRTRADRDVARAAMVIDGTAALPLEVEGSRFLAGELLVNGTGSYAFRFEDERGRVLAVGPPIAIVALDDALPEVRLLAPEDEVVVTERDTVELVFEASDDYGLAGLELVYQVAGGEEQAKPLVRYTEPLRRADGTHPWELSTLGLKPGDIVSYYLRALDNDAVSGPKRGQSRTQRLKVFSEAEHRRELLAKVVAAWEAMVSGLGDRIAPREGPRKLDGEARIAAGRPADDAVQAVTESLAALGAELGQDEKAPRELGLATTNIARTLGEKARTTRAARANAGKRGPLPPLLAALDGAEASEQRELEKDVLYLEALLDRQRLEEMRSLARELSDGRQDLARKLEALRSAPTDEAKRAAREEVGRLRERLTLLMRKMAELQRGIQDSHLNREALAELAKERDLLGGLDEIERLLEQGKIDEAMEALEQFGEQLDQMAGALDEARDSQAENDPALKELAEELQGFERELSLLRETQQQVARATEEVKKGQRKGVEERLKREGANLVDELRAKVERARVALLELPSEAVAARFAEQLDGAKERLEDLDGTLAAKDLDAALESTARALAHERQLLSELELERELSERFERDNAGAIGHALGRAGEAMRLTEEVKRALERVMPDPAKSMSAADKQRMDELAKRQGELEKQLGELKQRADRIGEKAPIFDPSAQAAMEGARESMGQAKGHLEGKEPGPALAAERRADEQLESLEQGLEQLKKQARGNKGGAGFPLPLAMGGAPGDDEGRDGRLDPNRKVLIPGADQYRVPEEYRKDILEAMKQGAPAGFEEDVKGYYEEIVK